MEKINVAVVGLGLGAEFIPIYQKHPDVECYAICQRTGHGVYDEEHEHTSFIQGSGHSGSRPHLTHEFIRAIVENRESEVDAKTAANWTMAGICAHESAMNNGKRIQIPKTG